MSSTIVSIDDLSFIFNKIKGGANQQFDINFSNEQNRINFMTQFKQLQNLLNDEKKFNEPLKMSNINKYLQNLLNDQEINSEIKSNVSNILNNYSNFFSENNLESIIENFSSLENAGPFTGDFINKDTKNIPVYEENQNYRDAIKGRKGPNDPKLRYDKFSKPVYNLMKIVKKLRDYSDLSTAYREKHNEVENYVYTIRKLFNILVFIKDQIKKVSSSQEELDDVYDLLEKISNEESDEWKNMISAEVLEKYRERQKNLSSLKEELDDAFSKASDAILDKLSRTGANLEDKNLGDTYKPTQQQAFDLKNVDSDIDSLKKEYQYMLENDPFALRVEVKIPENLKEQFENPKIKNLIANTLDETFKEEGLGTMGDIYYKQSGGAKNRLVYTLILKNRKKFDENGRLIDVQNNQYSNENYQIINNQATKFLKNILEKFVLSESSEEVNFLRNLLLGFGVSNDDLNLLVSQNIQAGGYTNKKIGEIEDILKQNNIQVLDLDRLDYYNNDLNEIINYINQIYTPEQSIQNLLSDYKKQISIKHILDNMNSNKSSDDLNLINNNLERLINYSELNDIDYVDSGENYYFQNTNIMTGGSDLERKKVEIIDKITNNSSIVQNVRNFLLNN